MKPLFAVQITDRDDAEVHKVVDALKLANLDYETFGSIHFTDIITNLEAFPKDRIVIPLAGTKILEMYLQSKLPSNWEVFYDKDEFDQAVYMPKYGKHLLNHEASTFTFEQIKFATFNEAKFIKPSDDRKAFPGLVIDPGSCLNEALGQVMHGVIEDSQTVLVSPIRSIGREFRCFMENDRIIDASEYASPKGIMHKKVDLRDMLGLRNYVRSLPYHPEGIYVIDICEAENFESNMVEYCVVEVNCFNCCGMYKVDCAKVFLAVSDYVDKNYADVFPTVELKVPEGFYDE